MRTPLLSSRRRSALLAVGVLAWLLLGGRVNQACWAAGGPPASTEEQTKAFTWFGTLGFPDAKGRAVVRVATGFWTQGGGPPENSYLIGLLLEDKGEDFTIFTLDLNTEKYHKTAKGTAEHERVGYDKLDLTKWAGDYLKWLHDAAAKKDNFMRQFGRARWKRQLAERAEVFVIAWICWRNGLEKEAGQFYTHAAAVPTETMGRPDRPAEKSFRQGLAVDIAHAHMWQAFLDFGDPSVSRPQLLERFERIVHDYPESEHVQRAKETADLLKQMIKEDQEHAKKRAAGKPFDQLSKREQIDELIFQLRDQNGRQLGQPGACDVFAKEYDRATGKWVEKNTPAHQLAKMGYDAVPQLIDALEDRRFSRSVGYHRDFYFSHHVLTIGDCAEQILAKIAGRWFRTYGKAGSAKAEVEAWYEGLKKKGEKAMLIEATEKGDQQSVEQAKLLLERYPDVAAGPILAGAKAAKEEWTRPHMVRLATQIKGDAPLSFLLAEVKDGPFLSCRVAAAEGLYRRGRSEGMAAMIDEWSHPRPPAKEQVFYESDRNALVRFLTGSGSLEALAALAKDLRKRPVDLRLDVVFGVGGGGDSKAVRMASEDLLVAELDDSAERIGMGGNLDGKILKDPRIADIAGHMLYRLNPKKYPFDLSASLAQRDRSIVVLKNAWRKEHGLAALPLPPARVIAPVADDKLCPLLDQFLKSPSAERAKWQGQIEQLGLGALPGVTRSLAKYKKEDPRSVALEQLAQRLASIVANVVVAEDSLKPEGDLARQLDALKGKPFDASLFFQIVEGVSKGLPKGVHAIQLSANKPEDGTGFEVKVDLLDEKRAAPLAGNSARPAGSSGKPSGYRFSDRAAVGSKTLHSISGSIGSWLGIDMAPLRAALTEASRAPAEQPVEIRVQVVAEWEK